MKIIRVKKYITRTIYVAFDGVEFDDEEDCLRYEAFISNMEVITDEQELFTPKEIKWYVIRRAADIFTMFSFLRLDLDKMDPDSDPVLGDGSDVPLPVLLLLDPKKGDWKFFTIETFKRVYQVEEKYAMLRTIDQFARDVDVWYAGKELDDLINDPSYEMDNDTET